MQNVDFSGHGDALTCYREDIARLGPVYLDNSDRREAAYNETFSNTFDFIAVSYTWGPGLPVQDILVTSSECRGWLSVRQNLYDFLKVRRNRLAIRRNVDELLEIKRDRGSALFWIDQICINQGKDDEKAHQVNQMAEIYSTAYVIEAWLGPGFEGSDELVDLIIHESNLSPQSRSYRLNVSEQEMRALIPSLGHLLRLSYWSRLWVTQEIVLGRVVNIRIGQKILMWETFYQGLVRLERAWECLRNTEKDEDLRDGGDKGFFRIHEINLSRGAVDKSWDSVRFLLLGTECENPRDRVFGMMGMLHPSLRVFPDYSMDPQDILLMLLTKEVEGSYTENERRSHVDAIRRKCLRTAANWLPQLEDEENRINPKSVRRHILKIVPLTPPEPRDPLDGLIRSLTYRVWASIPITQNTLERMMRLEGTLISKTSEFVRRPGRTWRLKYFIWKKIPNERNMLWRNIRADYERHEHISTFSDFRREYPIYDPGRLFVDLDSNK